MGGVSKRTSKGLRPDLAHGSLHGRIATGVAAIAQLPPQPHGGQAGIGRQPLAQIRQEWIGALLLPWLRPIAGRFQAPLDVSAHGLAIHAELAGDGRELLSTTPSIGPPGNRYGAVTC
jgi:hypothetical protein